MGRILCEGSRENYKVLFLLDASMTHSAHVYNTLTGPDILSMLFKHRNISKTTDKSYFTTFWT